MGPTKQAAGLGNRHHTDEEGAQADLGHFSWTLPFVAPQRRPRKTGLNPLVGWNDSFEVEWPVTSAVSHGFSRKAVGIIFVGRDTQLTLAESEALRREFDDLVDVWSMETMMSSSLHEICSHWAYQRVIGLGSPVVPLILADVLTGRRHWGWALAAITGENPAEDTDSPKAASEAWLQWGKERGFVADRPELVD